MSYQAQKTEVNVTGVMAAVASSLLSVGIAVPSAQLSHASGREYLSRLQSGTLPSEAQIALAGYPLLDLGCGRAFGYMAQFARLCGASEYHGVDLGARHVDRQTPEGMRVRSTQGELLEFLRSQPDGSANITMNAIDCFVTDNLRWVVEVAQEIGRVARVGGLVCGLNSLPLVFLRGQFMGPGFDLATERMSPTPSWKVLEGFWQCHDAEAQILCFGMLKKIEA